MNNKRLKLNITEQICISKKNLNFHLFKKESLMTNCNSELRIKKKKKKQQQQQKKTLFSCTLVIHYKSKVLKLKMNILMNKKHRQTV